MFLSTLGFSAALCLPTAQDPPSRSLRKALTEVRTLDGQGNNRAHPEWGRAGETLRRRVPPAYEDGVGSPALPDNPSPRYVSNLCSPQAGSYPNAAGVSDFFWQWGQFLDHDIDLTPAAHPAERLRIPVPSGDPWFDPFGTGVVYLPFRRSDYRDVDGVREQVNHISAYIDASQVYGSDVVRARALRTLDGTGRLRTSAGDLLPFNTEGLPNVPDSSADYFLAGDVRANEQVALTAVHTLFAREHNHWAEFFYQEGEGLLSGDEIYGLARAIVAAEMQAITYREFLPVLLGHDALGPYDGYRPDVDAGITNVFATAAYRFGHSMLSGTLRRLGASGHTIPAGDLPLAHAFFQPGELVEHGVDSLLRGLAVPHAQEVDAKLVDAVRNFLFGPPGSGGFDLASLNIQRGRDHGIPPYNDLRQGLGLPRTRSFAEISSDPETARRLRAAYGNVDDLDAWVGGLAEEPVPGALVGETVRTVLAEQFQALRDGDRFWYERYLPPDWVDAVEQQSLAVIVRRNTGIGDELQNGVFRASR